MLWKGVQEDVIVNGIKGSGEFQEGQEAGLAIIQRSVQIVGDVQHCSLCAAAFPEPRLERVVQVEFFNMIVELCKHTFFNSFGQEREVSYRSVIVKVILISIRLHDEGVTWPSLREVGMEQLDKEELMILVHVEEMM